jgi:hypothetical protein
MLAFTARALDSRVSSGAVVAAKGYTLVDADWDLKGARQFEQVKAT